MTVETTGGASLSLDQDDRAQVAESARFLEANHNGDSHDTLVVAALDGRQQVLPPPLMSALQLLSTILARGDDVAVVPLDKALSVTEVAELLNVSVLFLDKLLDDGTIPSVVVDAHRYVRLRDAMDYRRGRSERNNRLLDDVLSFAQEHGGFD